MVEALNTFILTPIGLTQFLLAAVATYGLASLVSKYDGYRGVFVRLRSKYTNSALNCTVCSAVWIAPFIYLLLFFNLYYLLYILAIVGLVIFIEEAL